MTTTETAPPKARAGSSSRRAGARPKSAARKARDAALRREIARIVRPMVERMVAQALEDRFDIEEIARARESGETPVPLDDILRPARL